MQTMKHTRLYNLSTALAADKALNYLLDPNASSAIKRYTGMSVCYACHGKGEQFMANPNVNTDRTTGRFLVHI